MYRKLSISGLYASTGLFYQEMLKQFGESRSYTAWMGSLMNAFFMLGGKHTILYRVIQKKTSKF